MPRSIALAAYAIKIWNAGERESEELSNFGDESDLLDFFNEFLTKLKSKASRDKGGQQLLRVQKLKKEDRRIFGIIETGEYGQESTLLDVETEKVAYNRKTTEANMLPFYFLVDFPKGVDEGVVLLQRVGMFGIRKMLTQVLDQEFENKFPDFRLRLHPLVDAQQIQKYQKGKIESIRFINFKIPSDITDCFDGGHQEKDGYAELVIHARRGSSLPIGGRLKQFFAGERKLSGLIALKETRFEYQDIKVRSRVGNVTRTVDLADLKKLRSYYDITEDVHLNAKTGHPKFESIHEVAEGLVNRIRTKIGTNDG